MEARDEEAPHAETGKRLGLQQGRECTSPRNAADRLLSSWGVDLYWMPAACKRRIERHFPFTDDSKIKLTSCGPDNGETHGFVEMKLTSILPSQE
jgi:hypothetical protein